MPVPTAAQFQIYTSIHEQVATAVADLTPAQLQAVPDPGAWSIQQILIHLADSEAVGYERLRRIIAEDHPLLHPYDEDAWGRHLHYHQQDPRLALELFHLLRQASAALLQQVSPASWERVGLHTENGEMSLYTTFLAYLDHGLAHLHQIEETRRHLSFPAPD